MTTTLGQAAQLLLDMFNQDYEANDAFIGIEHAKLAFCSEYADQVNKLFDRDKALEKIETGFSAVSLPNDWMVSEDIEVKDSVAILKRIVFAFEHDAMNSGVQDIESVGSSCLEFVRISSQDKWKLKHLPATDTIMWYVEYVNADCDGKVVSQIALPKDCKIGKIRVRYVPAVVPEDEGALISLLRVKGVIDAVLQSWLIAKGQVVIDKSNDQNNNRVPVTELNPDTIKQ